MVFGQLLLKKQNSYINPDYLISINPHLGVLDHFHVEASLGGSRLEPEMVPGHGWVEHGSFKFIWLSFLRSQIASVLLIIGF